MTDNGDGNTGAGDTIVYTITVREYWRHYTF